MPIESSTSRNAVSFMTTVKETATEQVEAGKTIAKLKAGNIILKRITKLAKTKLPAFARGYLDNPMAEMLIANAIVIGIKKMANPSKKTRIIQEGLQLAAAESTYSNFNIEEIANDILKGIDLSLFGEIEE